MNLIFTLVFFIVFMVIAIFLHSKSVVPVRLWELRYVLAAACSLFFSLMIH